MNLPHETLTQILGINAPYDPTTETTPQFMNGKFDELLENDKALKEQINVLTQNSKQIWNGSASTGTLTCSTKLTEFNELYIRFNNGFTTKLYSYNYPNNFNGGNYILLVPGGQIYVNFSNGDFTITQNSQNLSIGLLVGIKRGDRLV